MSARETKQPVAVVAESLMRVCYNEANRLANHGSSALERMVMHNLYAAANDAKARLAAAADDSEKAPDVDSDRVRLQRVVGLRASDRECDTCGGEGGMRQMNASGETVNAWRCPTCRGSGRVQIDDSPKPNDQAQRTGTV